MVRWPGIWSLQEGIYLCKGSVLSKVADQNTPIPSGSGNFTSFANDLGISGENVVFFGSGAAGGMYLYNGTTLSKVVDQNTPIPSGSGNFTGFYVPFIDSATVVFTGFGASGQQGIYLYNGTTLSKVVDLNASIPEGSGYFTGFAAMGVSGDNIAFWGYGVGQYGYYLASLQNPAVAVPSISEWGKIILISLLGLSALYNNRRTI